MQDCNKKNAWLSQEPGAADVVAILQLPLGGTRHNGSERDHTWLAAPESILLSPGLGFSVTKWWSIA